MQTISISSIAVNDRQRVDQGDLDNDFKSIREVGLVQPIVVEAVPEIVGRSPDTEQTHYRLIAGGRRLAWLQKNGFTELFHGVTCDPKRPGYVLASEQTEANHQMAELYENIKRHKLHWREECMAIAKVHRLKRINNKAEALAWSQEHTAALLGFKGAAKVTYALQIADELRDNKDSPLLLCETYSDAIKFLIEQTDRRCRAEQDRRRELANQRQLPLDDQQPAVQDQPELAPPPAHVVHLSSMLFHGHIEDHEDSLPPDHFRCTLVCTPIDDTTWLKAVHRLMAKDAFVIWAHGGLCPPINHDGFSLQPYPVIWHMLDLDPQPPHPFALNYVFFSILTKGTPVSCRPANTSIVTSNCTEGHLSDAVVQFLLQHTSIDGDDILMPCGGPAHIVAQMGRRPFCIERDLEKHNHNIETVKAVYKYLHVEGVDFV